MKLALSTRSQVGGIQVTKEIQDQVAVIIDYILVC